MVQLKVSLDLAQCHYNNFTFNNQAIAVASHISCAFEDLYIITILLPLTKFRGLGNGISFLV